MSSAASDTPLLPKKFGPYCDVRPLGKGGIGTVYRARDPRLNRDVVLKVCLRDNDRTAVARFRREAQAAAGLSHTNLCPVYEFDVRDGIAYLTMAFIEGPTLDAWVAQRGGLGQREAALLVAKLALAMQVAHECGVVHRDLKPANIIMNKRGEPVILDFGLAWMDNAGTRLTQDGAIYGTPSYMAPEQAGGDPTMVGPATDVYSLGVILYELLTGRVPFAGSFSAVVGQLLHATPAPLHTHKPAVDPTLEAICLKSLAKKPQDRYGNIKEMGKGLAQAARSLPNTSALHGPPPQAAPASDTATAPDRTLEKTKPSPRSVPQAKPSPRPAPQRAASPRSARPRERSPTRTNWIRPLLVIVLLGVIGAAGWCIYRVLQNGRAKTANRTDPNTNSLGMSFVHLPKGTFYMGGGGGMAGTKTEIKEDFEIAVHTVTQEQWAALMEGEDKYPSSFRRGAEFAKDVETISDAELQRFPVEGVSWEMAQAYIKKLNEKERGSGWLYRLPTDVEWEYACRGGAGSEEECSHHFYLTEPTDNLSAKEANFIGDQPFGTASKVKSLSRPTAVDDPAYPTNRLGLHHMHGNVWQWCENLYAEGGTDRVIRGGCWNSDGGSCRAGLRIPYAPKNRFADLGFRVVRLRSGAK